MITDLYIQHELLKTALDATDGYLGVEKQAKSAGMATNNLLHDFSYHMTRAHEALQSLGILDQHQDYMELHVKVMMKLHGHKDGIISDLPYTHVPRADFGEVDESKITSFNTFLKEESKEEENEIFPEEEMNNYVENLQWEDIVDLYDDNELIEEPEEVEEALSAAARIKKRQQFSRTKGRRNVARRLKLHRTSDLETLKRRALVAARRALYKRILRGRDKSTLSASEKNRVEQQVARLKYIRNTLVTKLLPKMRSIEQKRLSNYRQKK